LLTPFFCDAQVWLSFDDTAYKHLISIDTVHYSRNQWQVGRPVKPVFDSAYSAPRAMVTDTAHAYLANDTSVFILKLPQSFSPTHYGMPFLISLSFWYQLDIDSNAHAKVEMSGDTGHTWVDMTRDTSHFFAGMGGWPVPNLDTSTHGWQYFSVGFWSYLDSITADTTLFRFTFSCTTNDSGRDGWMIDDIVPEYYAEGFVKPTSMAERYRLYPNPVKDVLTIAAAERISGITICNLLGQVVYSRVCNSMRETIDVADLPRGLYMVRINGSVVTKFEKE
jgi:hypothetical protein